MDKRLVVGRHSEHSQYLGCQGVHGGKHFTYSEGEHSTQVRHLSSDVGKLILKQQESVMLSTAQRDLFR